MRIDHIALWTADLEKMRIFYQKYFNMKCGEKYENRLKGFSSFFLSFDDGARIELMTLENRPENNGIGERWAGLSHFAISVGSKEAVDALTRQLKADGIKVISEPRTTGDGYYESVINDPEGNQVEITA